jgi:hypothetical protein
MTSLFTKSLIVKSLVRSGIVVVSLALAGNPFAANDSHAAVNALRTAHPAQTHVAQAYRAAVPVPVAQIFQGLFGLPIPVTVGSARDTGGYDPTFDSPSPTVDVDNSQSQAAIDASDQAMQQEDQSLQDLDASVAAAEQQNDAANAAAVQTDINAGM